MLGIGKYDQSIQHRDSNRPPVMHPDTERELAHTLLIELLASVNHRNYVISTTAKKQSLTMDVVINLHTQYDGKSSLRHW